MSYLNMKCPVLLALLLISETVFSQERQIEIKGDRTLIYPQKMELTGEETLLDILYLYPEMLQSGFNELLTNYEPEKTTPVNSGYQLRMDNVAITGNIRTVLSTIKARDVRQIQICDQTGVAKGTGGLKGVIDINMLRPQEGTRGSVELQAGTDGNVTPIVNVMHGAEKNDLYVLASFDKPANEKGKEFNNTYAFAELTSRITPKDKLLTFASFQQNNKTTDTPVSAALNTNNTQTIHGRFRWFHTFNDKGTELLTQIGYQYSNNPQREINNQIEFYRHQKTRTYQPFALLELNTPLFTKDLSLMVGWEGQLSIYKFNIQQEACDETALKDTYTAGNTYRVFYNDFYLLFNYVKGIFRISLGDRLQLYNYGMRNMQHYAPDEPDKKSWSTNALRNMWQASIVVTPSKQHQLQLSYNRRVIHPSYLSVIPDEIPDAGFTFIAGNPELKATPSDVYKFAYGYSSQRLTAKAGASFIHTRNFTTLTEDKEWINQGSANTWKAEASVNYFTRNFNLSAGINYYNMKVMDGNRTSFVTGRFSAFGKLPKRITLNGTVLLFSSSAPIRKSHNNCCAYGQLSISKALGKNFNISAQWHDIFEKERSAVQFSVIYTFFKN